MKQLFLKRTYMTDGVTIGMLMEKDHLYGLTLENPWKDNQKNISCIPEGNYVCEVRESPKYGLVYHVLGVDGRTHILIHWGNYERNTQGCILLGQGLMAVSIPSKKAEIAGILYDRRLSMFTQARLSGST